LSTESHGRYQGTSSGTDDGRRVSDNTQALLLHKHLGLLGKLVVVETDIILEHEAGYCSRWLALRLHLGEDKGQVVIEVGVLIQGAETLHSNREYIDSIKR
jgi:hypothetical protein